MPEIVMPRLSDFMEEGTIVEWLFADGDEIAIGDELVEIEIDKTTVIYEAEVAGSLKIIAAEGTAVELGGPIANIG